MKKILVKHSHLELEDYEMGDCDKLENILSYWDKSKFKRIPLGYYYDDETKLLKVPRGVNIDYIAFITGRELIIDKNSNPYDFCKISLNTSPRDDDQRKSIAFLLGEREFKYTKEHSQLLLNLETGYGKTYCTIATITQMKQKTAIILDETKFMNQWKNCFVEYTDINEDDILVIQGSAMINKIISNPKKYNRKIYFISNKTLNRYGNKYGYDKLNDLFKAIRVGVKVYDEAHECFANIIKIDCNTNVKKTIYLTATAGRSDQKENKIFNFVFEHIPTFGKVLFTEDDKYINSMIFIIDTKPSYKDQLMCKNVHGFNTKAYLDYCFNMIPEPRDLFIRSEDSMLTKLNKICLSNKKQPLDNIFNIIEFVLDKFINKDGKIAIMFNKNEHIKIYEEYLKIRYSKYKDDIGVYSSLIPNKDIREKELDKKIILTTDKSFGKGTDVKNLRVFINTLTYRSAIQGSQFMGRLRYNPNFKSIYIEIVDKGFDGIWNQYLDRRKTILKKSDSVKEYKLYK